jgi:hypothetical protein
VLGGRAIAAAVAAVAAAAGARPLAAQTARCIGVVDEPSLRLRGYLRTLVSADDPSSTAVRRATGVALLDSAEVTVVTNARTCRQVLAGVTAAFGPADVGRRLYVYTIGRDYAAFAPGAANEAGGPVVILDAKFAKRAIIAAPSVY